MRLDRQAAATRIAASWRAQRTRDEPAVQVVRKRAAEKKAVRLRVRRLEGAVLVQRWARGRLARVEARRLRQEARNGEERKRRRHTKEQQGQAASLRVALAQHSAAVRMQTAARGRLARRAAADTAADDAARAAATKTAVRSRVKRLGAAVVVQCAWRRWLARARRRARREANDLARDERYWREEGQRQKYERAAAAAERREAAGTSAPLRSTSFRLPSELSPGGSAAVSPRGEGGRSAGGKSPLVSPRNATASSNPSFGSTAPLLPRRQAEHERRRAAITIQAAARGLNAGRALKRLRGARRRRRARGGAA